MRKLITMAFNATDEKERNVINVGGAGYFLNVKSILGRVLGSGVGEKEETLFELRTLRCFA